MNIFTKLTLELQRLASGCRGENRSARSCRVSTGHMRRIVHLDPSRWDVS